MSDIQANIEYLGINEIHCGDSLALLERVQPGSVKLVFTSPPYARQMKRYDCFEGVAADDYVDWFLPFARKIKSALADNGSFILNVNDCVQEGFRHLYVFDLVPRICREAGFRLFERLFWDKGKYLPHKSRFGDRAEYLFWFCKGPGFAFNLDEMRRPYDPISIHRMKKPIKRRFARTADNQDADDYKEWRPHPKGALPSTVVEIGSESRRVSSLNVAVFPAALPSYFIKGATNHGDLVLDPFSGSGTTCLAAKRLGRRYIGIEVSARQCEEAETRISEDKLCQRT